MLSGLDLPRYPHGRSPQDEVFPSTLIPSCYGSGDDVYSSSCSDFAPVATASGICHSFNAGEREGGGGMVRSEFVGAFRRAYDLTGEGLSGNASDLRMAGGDGDEFGITFYLDANTRWRIAVVKFTVPALVSDLSIFSVDRIGSRAAVSNGASVVVVVNARFAAATFYDASIIHICSCSYCSCC